MRVPDPYDLSEVGLHQVRLSSGNQGLNRLLGKLWKPANSPGGARNFLAQHDPCSWVARYWGAPSLADAASADAATAPEIGRLKPGQASQIRVSGEEREASGPRYRIRKVSEAASSIERNSQFAQVGSNLNILRNCDTSLRPPPSGLRRWGIFCDTAGRPLLHQSEGGRASSA